MTPFASSRPSIGLGLIAVLPLVAAALPAAALPTGACPDRARAAESQRLRLRALDSAPTVAFVRADALVEVLACDHGWARVDAAASGRGWLPVSALEPAAGMSSTATSEVRTAVGATLAEPDAAARVPVFVALPEERLEEPVVEEGSVEPKRLLLLREEPRWGSLVAGRSPAGRPVQVLSSSDLGWSLVDAGLDRPVWVVTAALHAPPLLTRP